jgi:hypothetical protein
MKYIGWRDRPPPAVTTLLPSQEAFNQRLAFGTFSEATYSSILDGASSLCLDLPPPDFESTADTTHGSAEAAVYRTVRAVREGRLPPSPPLTARRTCVLGNPFHRQARLPTTGAVGSWLFGVRITYPVKRLPRRLVLLGLS